VKIIRLKHKIRPFSDTDILAMKVGQLCTDQNSGIQTRAHERQTGKRGRRTLAMGTGDRDRLILFGDAA